MAQVVLLKTDGTPATAQEAYDAFMNTRVLLCNRNTGLICQAISMKWYDNNSAQSDPTNVGYVKLIYVYDGTESPTIGAIAVGDVSLLP